MDSGEGAAVLEWWANRSTCLGRLGVRLTVRAKGNDWTGEATFDPPLSEGDREGFDFLMELEPLFTLRFDDGSTILVDVSRTEDQAQLRLAAHEAEPGEPVGTRRAPHSPLLFADDDR